MTRRQLLTLPLAVAVCLSRARRAGAHAGHDTIPQDKAADKGRELVSLLLGRGKIDGSWKDAPLEKAELKFVEGIEQWHLVFRNDREPDVSNRRLYVFLSYDGQFLAANFSGKTQ